MKNFWLTQQFKNKKAEQFLLLQPFIEFICTLRISDKESGTMNDEVELLTSYLIAYQNHNKIITNRVVEWLHE